MSPLIKTEIVNVSEGRRLRIKKNTLCLGVRTKNM